MILRALIALLLVATPVSAEVVRIDVKSRTPVVAGQAFGPAGPYERLAGTIYFADRPAKSGQPDHRRHRQGAEKRRRARSSSRRTST